MKIHIVTIGAPKLDYAKRGWDEYFKRLGHYHQVRVTHLPDKKDAAKYLLEAAGNTYRIALVIDGEQLSSQRLMHFLAKRALEGREVCFLVGGPEGLPKEVIKQADYRWSLSELTFPHDLAMVLVLESLYRASTIAAGHPYHR